MKTSSVLASALMGSLAAAAPLKQRDMVTKTEMFVETVVVYTTIWDDATPSAGAAAATSTADLFAQQPSSTPALATYTPSPPTPSSIYTPPAAPATSKPYSSVVPISSIVPPPPPASSTAAPPPPPASSAAPVVTPSPAPVPSSVVTPAPVPSSTAAAPPPPASSAPASGGSGSGQTYSGDLTVYDTQGGYGACGTQLSDTDMIVALATGAMGPQTFDRMTGDATNPWCGQEIAITYNGKTVNAKIMDRCPGCDGDSIDLSRAVWNELTGGIYGTRLQGTWQKV